MPAVVRQRCNKCQIGVLTQTFLPKIARLNDPFCRLNDNEHPPYDCDSLSMQSILGTMRRRPTIAPFRRQIEQSQRRGLTMPSGNSSSRMTAPQWHERRCIGLMATPPTDLIMGASRGPRATKLNLRTVNVSTKPVWVQPHAHNFSETQFCVDANLFPDSPCAHPGTRGR